MDGLVIVGGDGRAVLASRFASSSSSNTLARAQYARIHLDRWHEDVLTALHVAEQQRVALPTSRRSEEEAPSTAPSSTVFSSAFPTSRLNNRALDGSDPLGRPSPANGGESDRLVSLQPPSPTGAAPPAGLLQDNNVLPASDIRLAPVQGRSDLPPVLYLDGVPPLAASLGKGRPEDDEDEKDSDEESDSDDLEPRNQHSLLSKNATADWTNENVWSTPTTDATLHDQPATPPPEPVTPQPPPGTVLYHKSHNDLHFLLPVSSATTPVLMPSTFLDFFIRLLSSYVGGAQYLTTDGVRENFDLIYALMEEVLDDGGAWPIMTEPWLLEKIVPPTQGWAGMAERWAGKVSASCEWNAEPIDPDISIGGAGLAISLTDSLVDRISASAGAPTPDAVQIRSALAGGGVPWRPAVVKHNREDILIYLIERIEGTFNRRGTLTRSTTGLRVDVTSRLSDTPQVSLALTPKLALTTPSFHPCVRIRPWHKDGVLDFVPPDGRFTLAHFARDQRPSLAEVQSQIPLMLECKLRTSFEGEAHKVDFRLDLESLPASGKPGIGRVSSGQTISQLVLSFQVPEDAIDMDCSLFAFAASSTSGGSTGRRIPDEAGVWLFDPKLRVLRWALGTIRPGRAVRMRGSFLTRDSAAVVASNVGVQFTVVDGASHTAHGGKAPLSGVQVSRISVTSAGQAERSGMEGFGSSSTKSTKASGTGGGAVAKPKMFKGVRSVLMADLEYRWS